MSASDSTNSTLTPFLPSQLPPPLAPPERLLLGPGPSDVPPRVLTAMATPTLGHLDPDFLELMHETQGYCSAAFRTRNELTLAITGPASQGWRPASST